LGLGLPYVGSFLPLPSAGELIHRFVSSWQPVGVGSTDPTSPATGVLGAAGYVLGGSTGLLQKILILGSIPVGAIGMARLSRPFGSWARVASMVVYLLVPVAYDAVAVGRFDVLVAYATVPWVLGRLARASGISPFARASAGPRHRPWRAGLPSQVLRLGVIDALATALAPSTAGLVLAITLALALGIVVVGGGTVGTSPGAPGDVSIRVAGRTGGGVWRAAGRVMVVGIGATAAAVVLLAPWSLATLSGPARWEVLTGVPLDPAVAPSWPAMLRLSLGPIGDTPLAYGMLGAAALPLLIGARRRLVWAGHAWVLVVGALALAWAEGRGWTAGLAIDPQALLVPVAAGVALAAGLGVAAFERDLSSYRFGWRQAAAVLAAGAAAMGAIPVLVAAGNGRWDLPHIGYGEATTFLSARSPEGGFRVLWLGDPRVLPGAGWRLGAGTAYSLSEDGLPDATGMWPASDAGPAAAVGRAVRLAGQGGTVELGALLAPYAVRYVIVVDALGPVIPGYQSPEAHPAPATLLSALVAQSDLRQVVGQGGIHVFTDDLALPEWSRHTTPADTSGPVGTASAGLGGWEPVDHPLASATVLKATTRPGAMVLARAPARSWELTAAPGTARAVPGRVAFGYAARFDLRQLRGAGGRRVLRGPVVLQERGSWVHGLEIGGEVFLWVLVLAVLVARGRWAEGLRPKAGLHTGGRTS